MPITGGIHTLGETNNGPSFPSPSKTTQATGSLLLAVNVGQGTVNFQDNKSNTWLTAASQNFNDPNGITHLFYVQNAIGGAGHIFTGTQSGGAGPEFLVGEFLGCALSGGPHAVGTPAELFGSTAAVVGPSVVTTVPGCLIATILVGGAPTLITPTSLNGLVTDAFSTNGNNVSGAMSWFVAGAAGTYSDTLTFAGQTAYDYAAYSIAFAPAAAAGSSFATAKAACGGMVTMSGGMRG